jgi:hypothetical protein
MRIGIEAHGCANLATSAVFKRPQIICIFQVLQLFLLAEKDKVNCTAFCLAD